MNEKEVAITRRSFLQGTAGAALSAAGWKPAKAAETSPAGTGRSRVVVVRDRDALDEMHTAAPSVLEKMLKETVLRVTGERTEKDAWRSLVKPEDRVGLVATPHLNPTHGELAAAVWRALVASGVPENQIRDAQGGPEKAEACTALISLPALKAHWLTGIGTVLKNYIMFSGRPSAYHRENSVKLAEIWGLPHVKDKTRLVLVDALRPLCDKGPQVDPRYLWDYKGFVAGTDPVAVETVCLRIMVGKRRMIRGEDWPLSPPPLCVEAADRQYGLGRSQWGEIEVETVGWDEDQLL